MMPHRVTSLPSRLIQSPAHGMGLWLAALLLAVCIGPIAPALGQATPRALPPVFHKAGDGIRSAFRETTDKPGRATVRIYADGDQVALGAVTAANGWIVTKASQVKQGDLQVRLATGGMREAKLIAVDQPFDLALLKVDAEDLPTIVWGDPDQIGVGHWLVTPAPAPSQGAGTDPVAVGVMSTPRRKIPRVGGVLGILLGDILSNGVMIANVTKDSGAADAGLVSGDVITHVNGTPTRNRPTLQRLVAAHNPGDVLKVRYIRDAAPAEIDVTLGARGDVFAMYDRGARLNKLGSALSMRRTGFPSALQHDTVLKPEQCGGPLVTLEGKAVGLNIARAGRVMSYAVPADVVQRFILKNIAKQPKSEDQKAAR